MFMFKCMKLKSTLPQFLQDLFTLKSDIHPYETTGASGIHTAVARTLIGGCLFIYSCSARLVSFGIKFKFINLKRN